MGGVSAAMCLSHPRSAKSDKDQMVRCRNIGIREAGVGVPPEQSNARQAIEQLLVLTVGTVEASAFERFWGRSGDAVAAYVHSSPPDRDAVLDALERYLDLGLARDTFGLDIEKAAQGRLERLDCTYDVWALLVSQGRRYAVRGKQTPWDEHERPMIESYRWEVKARRTRSPNQKIELFRVAADALSHDQTAHGIRREAFLRAHALRFEADYLLRSVKPYADAARQAIPLYEEAMRLARGSPLENLVRFRRDLCELRLAEVELDIVRARLALASAIVCTTLVEDSGRLFRRPNPWTSLDDLRAEMHVLNALELLLTGGAAAVSQAADELQLALQNCAEGFRRAEMEVRVLALSALDQRKNSPTVAELVHQIADRLYRPTVKPATARIYGLTAELQALRPPQGDELLGRMLPLLPLDAHTEEPTPLRRPLLYGAPSWLEPLFESENWEGARLGIAWYGRVVLDYLWSVHEKSAGEAGVRPRRRPPLRGASVGELANAAAEILAALSDWVGPPRAALEHLAEGLRELTEVAVGSGIGYRQRARELVRATEQHLFPLVARLRSRPDGVSLRRLDRGGAEYEYLSREVERPDTAHQFAYLKARYRLSREAPKEKNGRRLYLYPAPSFPVFASTCVIVEGPSDAAFFEAILDRLEPGWRLLKSDEPPGRPTIEIRVARGANNVPDEYDRAIRDHLFLQQRTELEAGQTRILVVLDSDHESVFTTPRSDIGLCPHQVVLRPDLERLCPRAFEAAVSRRLGRPLSRNERHDLNEWIQLPTGSAFGARVEKAWELQLKRTAAERDADSFARELAQCMPARGGGQLCDIPWQIGERILQLASGPVLLRPWKASGWRLTLSSRPTPAAGGV